MHNLSTVIRFEITRTLKKKSFWIAAFAVPIIAGLVGMIIFFSNKTTDDQTKKLATERYSIGVTDTAGLINPGLLKSLDARAITTESTGEDAVKTGKLDAYFYYPADISKDTVKVFGKDVGLFKNSRYQDLANQLLKQSTAANTSPAVRSVLQGSVKYDAITYTKSGDVDKGFMKLIAPGIFLVLFYFMIATFGNQILTSVTEEKENRVSQERRC